MPLNDGERQVAPDVSGIRADHVARYEWAARVLPAKSRVLDVGCGVGYGAHLLAQAGHTVVAFDRSAEAIAYAREHYAHPNICFICHEIGSPIEVSAVDAAIAFEIIEHLADPLPMLRWLRDLTPLLLASVPNEKHFPYRNYKFHHRHYTKSQLLDLLTRAGFVVEDVLGQIGPESPVERAEGRTLMALARSAAALPKPVAALDSVPAHVAIVGLGPSSVTFFELTRRLGGVSAWCDEVWGINAIGDVLRCDRVFHMDDVRVQELRAAANPDGNIAAMLKWLKTHPGPVYTSVVREGYPGLVAFPIEDVLNRKHDNNGGAPYFNSTAAYAIAYAVHIGVKQISLWGLDYTRANAHHGEQGRACCEFWLGIAAARGIEITIPDTSALMDACEPDERRLYGYDCVDVRLLDQPDGMVKVAMAERETIPSAAEIEARYDHVQPVNPLMRQPQGEKR